MSETITKQFYSENEHGAITLLGKELGLDVVDTRSIFMDEVESSPLSIQQEIGDLEFNWVESRNKLVSIPIEDQFYTLRTLRNRNLRTKEEQEKLRDQRPAVLGLSVGSNIALSLAKAGIGKEFILADMDTTDPTNLNRMPVGIAEIGESKISATAEILHNYDPYLSIVCLGSGFTLENVNSDITDAPTILFEEVDNMKAKIDARKYAQTFKIPLIMASDTGELAIIDSERYDIDEEEVSYFNGRAPIELVQKVDEGHDLSPEEQLQLLGSILGMENVSERLLMSYLSIGTELGGVPQLGSTVQLAGAAATKIAAKIILGEDVKERYIVSID